jgi:hypothetical protein
MNSWKTTVFGLLGGIGAAVAMVDGLPHWLLISARVAAAAGVAGLGLAARDNNKTSEQVGAGTTATFGGSPSRLVSLLLAATILTGLVAGGSLVGGCGTTPQKVAYATAGTTVVTVDAAMSAWGDYVKAYHPPATQEAQVKAMYEHYQASMVVVVDANQLYVTLAGSGSTNSPPAQAAALSASAVAAQAFADLLNLLRSFGVKI